MVEGDGEGQTTGAQPVALDVFISYASQDAAIATVVVDALERSGIVCWVAPRDVTPGAFYADEIVHAIEAAKAIVLILSKHAAASQHVLREVEHAASKRQPVVSLRVDQAPLPAGLGYFLNASQWLDASNGEIARSMPKLVAAVRVAIQAPAAAPEATPKPRAPAPSQFAWRQKHATIIAASLIGLAIAGFAVDRLWVSGRRAAPNSVPTAAVPAPAPAPAAPTLAEKSVAVLPFVDMSEKQDQEYFADGMAEEILDLLAKVPGLIVIGRTSSFQFKSKNEDLRTIGAKLGAAFVVEGSVRRAGPRIRVTAQLIDARSGAHRWSESYDRDFGDILALQDEIATGIARALQLSIDADESLPPRQLPNAEAYALYLRGLLAQDQQSFDKLFEAVQDFEQSLTLNPAFLRAAEALARAHVDQGFDEAVLSHEAWQAAREAAQRTLRIDSKSATAHAVLGLVHGEDEFDWKAADVEFNQALASNPRDPVALSYAAIFAGARGLTPESQRLFSASLAVDPLNPYTQQHLGQMLIAAGDFAGAQVALRKSIAINESFDGNHYQLSRIHLARNEIEAAMKEIQLEVAPDAKDAVLAMIYHASRRKTDSDAALARLIREAGDTWPYSVATVYAYRGERNEAFQWLEKGFTSRDSDQLEGIRGDPEFAALREDARYKTLLRKMNLPE